MPCHAVFCESEGKMVLMWDLGSGMWHVKHNMIR